MKKCIVVAVGLAAWIGFGAVEIGGLPAWEIVDTEVSTNVPLSCAKENARHLLVSLELAGTPSNNVEVAFGRDVNTNGVLEVGEIGMTVGWECGEWKLRVKSEELRVTSDEPGVLCDEWTAEPVTTNRVKRLDFDVTVSRMRAKGRASFENGVTLGWGLAAQVPEELFGRSWDTLKLTVRGVDRAEESLRAKLQVAGTVLRIR